MRFLLCTLFALACAAPACDTHEGAIGSGSGSSAWSRMPSAMAPAGSASHEDVVHAMEAVTGASLEHAAKPGKPKVKHGGGGGSTSASKPAPPPEPELPESGRMLGQKCWRDDECASNLCEFEVCAKRTNDKLTNGEKCDYDHECVSNHCYHDVCEE